MISDTEEVEQRDTQREELENNEIQASTSSSQKTAFTKETRKAKNSKKPTYEESLLQILKESKTEEIDEDKLFLLSLWPSFRILSPQQKITAKMGFLQVLQQVGFSINYQQAGISSVSQNSNMNNYPHFQQQISNSTNHVISQHYSSSPSPQQSSGMLSPEDDDYELFELH